MKVSESKLGSLIIGLAIIASSCVREGCMDEAAVNFDGVFIDSEDEYFSAKLKITFSN